MTFHYQTPGQHIAGHIRTGEFLQSWDKGDDLVYSLTLIDGALPAKAGPAGCNVVQTPMSLLD